MFRRMFRQKKTTPKYRIRETNGGDFYVEILRFQSPLVGDIWQTQHPDGLVCDSLSSAEKELKNLIDQDHLKKTKLYHY